MRCGAGGIQLLQASRPSSESPERWAGTVTQQQAGKHQEGARGQTLPEGWEGGCWMGMAGDLGKAELLSGKTPWQEQAAGAEVNTQMEVGSGVLFGPGKTKMTSSWAILAAFQK